MAFFCLSLYSFAESKPNPKKVTCTDGDCQDIHFQVKFTLPFKWKVEMQRRWKDAGEEATTLTLQDPGALSPVGLYYRLLTNTADEDIRIEVGKKLEQRIRQGLPNYRLPENNCQERVVGGHQALSCMAAFGGGAEVMLEYFTWIRSKQCLAQFWVQSRPETMGSRQKRLEDVIQSLQIP